MTITAMPDTFRAINFPKPPDLTRVIVIANQKGGVGKTTSTVNLGATLALHGGRVLVVDTDPQGNASTALGIDHHAGTLGTYEVLIERTPIKEVMQVSPHSPSLYVVPATIDLAGAEIELVSLVARENRLSHAIDAVKGQFDYILIDCPPSLGLLTLNALTAAEEVLIPMQCEYYALEGLSQLMGNIDLVRGALNDKLHISAVLMTMYNGTNLADGVVAEVAEHFGERVLRTKIPRQVKVSEAPSYQMPAIAYDRYGAGAMAYVEAARELAERGRSVGQ